MNSKKQKYLNRKIKKIKIFFILLTFLLTLKMERKNVRMALVVDAFDSYDDGMQVFDVKGILQITPGRFLLELKETNFPVQDAGEHLPISSIQQIIENALMEKSLKRGAF